MKPPLTFQQLRIANVARCGEVFHPLDDWSYADWVLAIIGELGEASNLLKKKRRGDPISDEAIGDEMADAMIYLDLFAARARINLGEAVERKFNKTSDEKKSGIKL